LRGEVARSAGGVRPNGGGCSPDPLYRCDLRRALISWASCSRREESTKSSEMLGIWSIAPSIPDSDGSAAPRMSFTFRARLPSASSAIACSSETIGDQSRCGPPEGGGGVVGATCIAGWEGGVGRVFDGGGVY